MNCEFTKNIIILKVSKNADLSVCSVCIECQKGNSSSRCAVPFAICSRSTSSRLLTTTR